jgi:hypothetical protein
MTEQNLESAYLDKFRNGSFTSALRWHNLDDLWEVLRADVNDDWYLYAIGSPVPEQPSKHDELLVFIEKIDELLRKDHEEDYCGIVYADDLKSPTMVKIFDPHNLGVTCGYSDNPPLPGWVISKLQPVDLVTNQVIANNRKKWWQKLFS